VRIIKHFWQSLARRFKQRASRPAGEFDRELSAARQEQQSLLGQLTGLHAEVERGLSTARQEQQSLLGQLNDLQANVERQLSAAELEKQALRGELTDLKTEVERGLSATRQEQQHLLGQISGLQDDLERLRSRDEQLRSELQQRFDHLQAERDAAHEEVKTLWTSLADAMSRQETTKTRVNTLEIRLQEQWQQHQAALQESLVRERRQARRLTAAMTVAAAAFLLGIVGGAINFWEVRNTTRLLAEVSQGIKDIQTSMEGRPTANAPVPSTAAAPEKRASTNAPESRPAVAEGTSRAQEDVEQGLSGQKLPEPDFIASKSLPLNEHTFSSRQDARAFFEENAKQPGVVALPSGLQYRVLIPGAGKSPKTSDQVVVEYRAFRPDGTETDNSFKEDLPTTFTVDKAIPALKEALQHMEEGAQWELYIPADLAYAGVRKRSPYGFEPLILTVELISVVVAEPVKER
jgi:FKBP-type peptidyl-prolyl cis-trans isomerase